MHKLFRKWEDLLDAQTFLKNLPTFLNPEIIFNLKCDLINIKDRLILWKFIPKKSHSKDTHRGFGMYNEQANECEGGRRIHACGSFLLPRSLDF